MSLIVVIIVHAATTGLTMWLIQIVASNSYRDGYSKGVSDTVSSSSDPSSSHDRHP